MRRGEIVDAWTGVIEGLVKMSSVSAAGKSVTFTGIGAGGWFGEGSLLKSEARKYDIVALRDTRIAWMPRSTFDWLLSDQHRVQPVSVVAVERAARISSSVWSSTSECSSPMHASRAASRRCSIRICIPAIASELEISQEEIGYLSGVSRQRVNQALQVLARAKLVEVEYGSVRIVDLAALRRYGG